MKLQRYKRIRVGTWTEEILDSQAISPQELKARLSKEKIVVLGYGVQGRAQALNLRDQHINVSVGQRKNSARWQQALKDGWIENKNLFPLKKSFAKGTCYLYLLSDAGQVSVWPQLLPHLTQNKTLCLAHGFILAYADQTRVSLPPHIDAFVLAPKGSGISLRQGFVQKQLLNAGYVTLQNTSSHAEQTLTALAKGIGVRYLFPTTLLKEVYADLTGERGALVAGIAAMFDAQYEVLRKYGHSPLEAFNETVEEFTQSLLPLIAQKGIDGLIPAISTTAQVGFPLWQNKFKQALKPLFEKLYQNVKKGTEARRVLNTLGNKKQRQCLKEEILRQQQAEIWQAGKEIRKLRPS